MEQVCIELVGGSLPTVIVGGVVTVFSVLANFVSVDTKVGKIVNFLAVNLKHIKAKK